MSLAIPSGREQELLRFIDPFFPNAHPALLFQPASHLVEQTYRQMAHTSTPCLCVLSRKEDSALLEIYMPQLDPHELADSASELVDHTHHELVFVVVDRIKKSLPFFPR
jgi:hypothetical protein